MVIYNINGTKLLDAILTEGGEHEEELGKTNLVRLSWNSDKKVTLPAGAYIIPFNDGLKYRLLDTYTPSEDSKQLKYAPEFHHPLMILSRVPFLYSTTDQSGAPVKQQDWSFDGLTTTALQHVCDAINEAFGFTAEEDKFTYTLCGTVDGSVNFSVSSNDILSVISLIAQACKSNSCEGHLSWEHRTLYFGQVSVNLGEDVPLLKVHGNLQVASVTASKEAYYNCFYPQGSTKNMSSKAQVGTGNVATLARLCLNTDNYPDGCIYIDANGKIISKPAFDASNAVRQTLALSFDDVYPHINLYAYNIRKRTQYVKNGDTGEYMKDKVFTIWYMRLAYCTTEKDATKTPVNTTTDKDEQGNTVTHYWYDYELDPKKQVLQGHSLMGTFKVNTHTTNNQYDALTQALVGQPNGQDGFEFAYHEKSQDIPANSTTGDSGFSVQKGDYEIIKYQSGDVIIPSNEEDGLIPRGNRLPDLTCNIVILFNIVMGEYETTLAQEELATRTIKEIERRTRDNNNYTAPSNAVEFEKKNPNLYIGQQVTYDDGQGYQLSTRVIKLVTKLDYPIIQEITVGNQAVKGNITQLKEDVKNILSGNFSGGGLNERQVSDIIRNYTGKHFLSKLQDDTARGLITFLKGLVAQAVSYFKGIVNNGNIINTGDIVTRNLRVTEKATFFQLEIQKAKAAGGMTVHSAGTFHIDAVEEATDTDGYVCYQRAEQDGVKLRQRCEVSDQMMCSNGMNILKGGKGNHFYWRKVTEAPKKVVTHTINGKEEKCLKIVLSKTDHSKNTVDIPQVGDDLVQIGNPDNKERQSVIMTCAYNSFDPDLKAPYWVQYTGVNDYDISKHRYTWFAANGSQVTGNFKVQSDNGGLESIEDYMKGLATNTYKLVMSGSQFNVKADGSFSPEFISIYAYKAQGENLTQLSPSESVKVRVTKGESNLPIKGSLTVISGKWNLWAEKEDLDDVLNVDLLINDKLVDKVVDKQKIHIVRDGRNGISGKNAVVWHVAFSIRNITGKQGETLKLRYGRTEGENTSWYDDNPINHGFDQLYAVIIDGATGNERQAVLAKDLNVADFFTGGSMTVRLMNSKTGDLLAQDTIYPEAKSGNPGKDAVTYKLLPLSENALAYITEDKETKVKTNKVALKLKYKIQKSVGEQVNFTTLTAEGMMLSIQPSVGEDVQFTYDKGMYSLSSSMDYDKMTNDSYVVTLKKGGDIVDQRIVPITFKPKVLFDIDTENGRINSEIVNVKGKVNRVERNINETKSTVGDLEKQYSQIHQTAKEVAIEQISKTTGRDNLLVGSAFRNENEIKWYNKTDPTHHKCLISRTVNCLGTNSVMIESTSTKETYLGVAFWGIQVNAGGKYNLSCQIYKEANVNAGRFDCEVKCYRKDKSRATVFKPPLNVLRAEDDKWTLNQTDFAVGDDVDYIDVFFWVEKAGRFYLARPMLREGEGYTKWSLSQFDYGYVGGNMLDGTKNFDGAHINVNKCSAVSYNGNVNMSYSTTVDEYFLSWHYDRGLLKTDTDYVLSFVAKGDGDVGVTIYGGDNKTVFSEGGDGAIIPYDETPYGEQRFTLTRDFRKYWVRIRTSKSFDDATQVGFRTYSDGAKIELYNVKLEEGATDTAYTDSTEKLVSEDLFMRAGIYLRDGKIILDAKNTIVKENLTTKRLLTNPTYAGGPYAEIYGSEFLIRYGDGKKGAQFGIGDDGLLHLIFFDANGKAVGDLGPGGWSKLVDATTEPKWTEIKLKNITGAKDINVVRDVMDNSTPSYYRFTAARNSELGLKGENAEYDNQLFIRYNDFSEKIHDGWYIDPNNGNYKAWYIPYEPLVGEEPLRVYFTRCYHYMSGKLQSTVNIYYTEDGGILWQTDRNGKPLPYGEIIYEK